MRILAVRHSLPEHEFDNEYCRLHLRTHLGGRFTESEVCEADSRLAQFLVKSGTRTRRLSDPAEKPLDFLLAAARNALKDAQVEPSDIDFVIYAGVSRGWIEPATATVVQSELRLTNASAFDIVEACASWLRAMQVAHSFLRGGVYRCGLIVNCECGLLRLAPLRIDNLSQLDRSLARFTLGEAATATVVARGDEDDFYFRLRSAGEHFRLCMIPLPSIRGFLPDSASAEGSSDTFFSDSEKLIGTAVKRIIHEFRADARLTGESYDIVFTHSASSRASEFVVDQLGLPRETLFDIHSRFGNTVSASVPLGMSVALNEGRLNRGQKVLVMVGSAGITVGFATFTF